MCEQIGKHVQHQPFLFNGIEAVALVNPGKKERAWVCKNIRGREGWLLPAPAGRPAATPALTAAEAAAVAKNVSEILGNSGTGLPGCCKAERIEASVDDSSGDGSASVAGSTPPAAIKVAFNWTDAHRADPCSTPLLDTLRPRMIPGGATTDAASSATAGGRGRRGRTARGGGAPAGGAGGARPPPTPPVSGVAKPRRGRRGAGVTKSVRSVRTEEQNAQLVAAEEMATDAFLQGQAAADVVTPPYTVREVEPNKAWAHGGVLVVVQFPFAIDDSWRQSLTHSHAKCRLVVPAGTAVGGGLYLAAVGLYNPNAVRAVASGDAEHEAARTDDGAAEKDGVEGDDAGEGSGDEGSGSSGVGDGSQDGGSQGGDGGAREGGAGDDGTSGGGGGDGGIGGPPPYVGEKRDTSPSRAATRFLPVSIGLHDVYLSALGMTNAQVGVAAGSVVRMRLIKGSAPSPFELELPFYYPKDLDVTAQASCVFQDRNQIAVGFPTVAPLAGEQHSFVMKD